MTYKKGKSQLHKRNEDMRSLLESMEMGYETLGFELQLHVGAEGRDERG